MRLALRSEGALRRYSYERLEILQGDFFDVSAEQVAPDASAIGHGAARRDGAGAPAAGGNAAAGTCSRLGAPPGARAAAALGWCWCRHAVARAPLR